MRIHRRKAAKQTCGTRLVSVCGSRTEAVQKRKYLELTRSSAKRKYLELTRDCNS